MWEEIRRSNVAAIVLVAVAIVAGGLTDIDPGNDVGTNRRHFQGRCAIAFCDRSLGGACPSKHSSHTFRDAWAAAFVLCFDAPAGRRLLI